MNGKALSDRAKQRLRIAAGLLRSQGMKFDGPRDEFYETIQAAISALTAEQQERLKGHVDWVEDYENAGRAFQAQVPTSSKRL